MSARVGRQVGKVAYPKRGIVDVFNTVFGRFEIDGWVYVVVVAVTLEVGQTVIRLCVPEERYYEEKDDTKGEEARSPGHTEVVTEEMHRQG